MTVKRTFQGDPRLIMGPNGTTIKFVGGQPVMDAGVENLIQIRLFTRQGWVGNYLFPAEANQLGSDFEDVVSGALTLDKITDGEKAAQRALNKLVETGYAESTEAEITNPTGDILDLVVTVKRPNQEAQQVTLSRINQVWQNQADDPAYKKI